MSRSRQAAVACPPGRFDVFTLAHELRSGARIVPHHHAEHQLVYATQGVMTVDTDRGSWVVPPHRAVWVPSRTTHAIAASGTVSMRTVYLRPRLSAAFATGCMVLNVQPLLRELVLHAVELGTLSRRVPRQARLIAVLVDQLAHEHSAAAPLHLPEPQDARARRVAQLLQGEPGNQQPIGELLRGVGASQRTIERLFLAETGLTLGRWRQQLRLLHSLRLLASGAKVTAVALDVGYDSASAFVSMFRKAFGITPGRYFGTEPARQHRKR